MAGWAVVSLLLLSSPGPVPAEWTYRAKVLGDGALGLEAKFPAGSATLLTLPSRARPFVQGLEIAALDRGPFRSIDLEWSAPECARGCRLRYRFPLIEATRRLAGVAGSSLFDGGLLTSTSLWLVRPEQAPLGMRYQLRFEAAAGQRFLSGLSPIDPYTYQGPAEHLSPAPFAVLGEVSVRRFEFGDRRVELAYPPGRFKVGDRALELWVDRALRAVTDYYGRFPVPHALVVLVPIPGHETGRATAMGFGGASVRLEVGVDMSEAELAQVWELVHELTHLGLANLGPDHHWIEEGLATYLEPVIRVRAGLLSRERYWRELQAGLQNGLPTPESRGFNGTRSWGETYWGGALYFFLADLQIRRATHGKKSLDDALRAIVAAGLDLRVFAEVEEVLKVGDRATGTTVLFDLYQKVAHRPYPVDLAPIWKSLGVVVDGDRVRFNAQAPEARIREAMTRP
jgi:hypothetical protein